MNCRQVQERLAEDPKALQSVESIAAHVRECPDCQRVLARLSEVDETLQALEGHKPPHALVDKTLRSVHRSRQKAKRMVWLKPALVTGFSVMLLLGLGVLSMQGEGIRDLYTASQEALAGNDAIEPMPEVVDSPAGEDSGLQPLAIVPDSVPGATVAQPVDEENQRDALNGKEAKNEETGLAAQMRLIPKMKDGQTLGYEIHSVRPDSTAERAGLKNGDVITRIGGASVAEPDKALRQTNRSGEDDQIEMEIERDGRKLTLNMPVGDPNAKRNDRTRAGGDSGVQNDQATQVFGSIDRTAVLQVIHRYQPRIQKCYEKSLPSDPHLKGRVVAEWTIRLSGAVDRVVIRSNTTGSLALVDCIVAEIQRWRFPKPPVDEPTIVFPFNFQPDPESPDAGMDLDGKKRADQKIDLDKIQTIPARGYFENTYLPGDPALAWLKKKLQSGVRLGGQIERPEEASKPYWQPFDPPASDGLAVYLGADRAAVDGPTRLTLQVGLKGSERLAARRGPVQAALVVDLLDIPDDVARRMLWRLADGLAANQEAGDRFWLLATGVDQPLLVEPGHFEPVTVRRSLALGLQQVESGASGADLLSTLQTAYAAIRGGSPIDQAPLGANLVLVATSRPMESRIEQELKTLVHTQALSGISLTTIGTGPQVNAGVLAELARLGQGRRRLMTDPEVAPPMLVAELNSAGSVVARAVRLRIRLAEGVRLVKIHGSRPLGRVQAEQVREEERAIDQRVSATLGIQADRGQDEDGIQIIIPAYYAGDDHVILLDVVAEGPGELADVRVRYKDLVNMQNAVASARLDLKPGQQQPGRAERLVARNLMAFQLSQDLQQAAEALADGRLERCRDTLNTARQRFDVPGSTSQRDGELDRDVAMLSTYLGLLERFAGSQTDSGQRIQLARSLAYAARVKLPPGEARQNND